MFSLSEDSSLVNEDNPTTSTSFLQINNNAHELFEKLGTESFSKEKINNQVIDQIYNFQVEMLEQQVCY